MSDYRIRTTVISPRVSITTTTCEGLDEAWLVYLTACEELHEQMLSVGGDGAGGVDLRDASDQLIEHRLFAMRAGILSEETLAGDRSHEADDPKRDFNGG